MLITARRRLPPRTGAWCWRHKANRRRHKRRLKALPHLLVARLQFHPATRGRTRRGAGSYPRFFCSAARKARSAGGAPGERAPTFFFLASVKHFLAKAHRHAVAVKRGEGKPPISLDELLERKRADLEPPDTLSPDRIFERRWALTVLEQALARLDDEYLAIGKARLFKELKKLLTVNTNWDAPFIVTE
jgi:hypothetical protein